MILRVTKDVIRRKSFHFHPVIHSLLFRNSRHLIGKQRLVNTASIRQWMMAPSSSSSTSVTRKCFSFPAGRTAVHLLLSNFFVLSGFTILPAKFSVLFCVTSRLIHGVFLFIQFDLAKSSSEQINVEFVRQSY